MRRDGATYSSARMQMDIVDTIRQLGIRKRRYRIPAISPSSVAQSTDTFARDMYDDGHLAQSAHDRSMSPLFPPSGELLLGYTATTVRRSTLSPSPLPLLSPPCCCVHNALRVTTLQPLFFVRPCRRYPDSSPVPLVLLPLSRRKRERRRRNKRLEEVAKKEEEEQE